MKINANINMNKLKVRELVRDAIKESIQDMKKYVSVGCDQIEIIDFIIDYYAFDKMDNLSKSFILDKLWDIDIIYLTNFDLYSYVPTHQGENLLIDYLLNENIRNQLTLEQYIEKVRNVKVLKIVKDLLSDESVICAICEYKENK